MGKMPTLTQLQLKDLVMRVIFDEAAASKDAADKPAAEGVPGPPGLARLYSDGSDGGVDEADNGFRLFKQMHLKIEDIQSAPSCARLRIFRRLKPVHRFCMDL